MFSGDGTRDKLSLCSWPSQQRSGEQLQCSERWGVVSHCDELTCSTDSVGRIVTIDARECIGENIRVTWNIFYSKIKFTKYFKPTLLSRGQVTLCLYVL